MAKALTSWLYKSINITHTTIEQLDKTDSMAIEINNNEINLYMLAEQYMWRGAEARFRVWHTKKKKMLAAQSKTPYT